MEVVLNLLNSIFTSNPHTSFIDLEFSQLTSIAPILSSLMMFKSLKQMSLHGNRLTELPEDLSMLESLEELDITNNLIQKIENVIPGLKTLKSLRKLAITIKNKEEQIQLIQEIPNLQILNNEKVYRSETIQFAKEKNSYNEQFFQQTPASVEKSTIKQEDLETLSSLYDSIRQIHKEVSPENDNVLAEQFDEHVRNILYDLNSKLEDQTINVSSSKSLTIKAKYALFEICFSKFMEYLEGMDQRLAIILESLHDSHALIFKEMSTLLTEPNSIQNFEINQTKNNYDPNEIQQIVEAAENFEAENQRLNEEKQELIDHISNLEQENQKFLELILKFSKGDKKILSSYDLNKYKEIKNHEKENSQIRIAAQVLNPTNQSAKLTESNERPFFCNIKAGISKSAGISSNIGHINVRVLTLKQLKDVIEEINESKLKYDKKCFELKMPRETMEQHMYSFLNQKYGLKNLIIEWATAIINGIKKYAFEDNDITVFAKILRNECDEEFRLVQNQVKNTIVELLRMHLRGKFPFKHNSEIKEMIDSKINGYILQDESQDIIKYMYNKEDAETIIDKLRSLFVVSKEPHGKKAGREGLLMSNEKEKLKISFFQFQKIILDFQLKSHENFLQPFLMLFKHIDKDNNGIIDENEFKEMVELTRINLDIEKLLYNVDPFDHKQITFSQLVTLFSSEMILKDNKNLSVLQILSQSSD